MHHIDGSTHISGTEIRSGFYKSNKKPKGVHSSSMNLIENNNDGGPIFIISVWGIEKFKNRKRYDTATVIESDNIIKEPNMIDEGKDAYIFEGYYMPRDALNSLSLDTLNITYDHPSLGIVPLKYIKQKKSTPGVIGILCKKSKVTFPSDHGIVIGGGPGVTLSDNTWEQINIIYPLSMFNERKKDFKSLDYKGKYKLYDIIDRIIFKINNF
jgi:hypothetical protein